MDFLFNSIRNKLAALLIVGGILTLSTSLFTITNLNANKQAFASLVNEDAALKRDILLANSLFQTQVQEWKNTLLRGSVAKDYDKYWGRFNESKTKIIPLVEDIAKRSTNTKVKNNVEAFLIAYDTMMVKYQEGHDVFIEDYDHKTADSIVRGIDREPSKLLKSTADIIGKDLASTSKNLIESSNSAINRSVPIVIISQVIVIALLIWLLTKTVVNPTQSLLKELKNLQALDFRKSIQHSSKDEVGQLADGIEQLRRSLIDMVNEIAGTTHTLTSASEQMHSTAGTIQGNTTVINDHMGQAATATNEMSATIQEVAKNANGAAEAARSADEQAKHGQQIMNDTIGSINALSTEVSNTATAVQELEEHAASVASVLDVIVNIAEQTNLLALNAAIEAARAGEQGRGFAVVADEVRTLAQRTQDSTGEIKSIIEATEQGASKAAQAMNQGLEKTQQTVELASQAGDAINQINHEVSQISSMNIQIATAAEEQSAVAEEINRSITTVADKANDTAYQASQSSEVSNQLKDTVDTINTMVSQYKV